MPYAQLTYSAPGRLFGTGFGPTTARQATHCEWPPDCTNPSFSARTGACCDIAQSDPRNVNAELIGSQSNVERLM